MPNGERLTRDLILQAASYWPSRVITVAVKLRLFTILSDGKKPIEKIAEEARADARPLRILLDALVALGLTKKHGEAYENVPIAEEVLVEGRPGNLVHRLTLEHDSFRYWDRIEAVIRTGEPSRTDPIFETDPTGTELLLRSFHELARFDGPALAEQVGPARRLLDLGGGSGSYAMAFCQAYLEMRAVLFDFPISIRVARQIVAESPAADRIEFLTGDYRKDPLGGPYDLALLSNIIHGEGPEQVVHLLEKVYGALEGGGRIVIRDFFLNEDRTNPAFGALFSVNMLIHTPEGRSYSEAEAREFLQQAGFEDVRMLDAEHLMQATRPGQGS